MQHLDFLFMKMIFTVEFCFLFSSNFSCVGCLFFETEDGYDRGIAGAGKVLGVSSRE